MSFEAIKNNFSVYIIDMPKRILFAYFLLAVIAVSCGHNDIDCRLFTADSLLQIPDNQREYVNNQKAFAILSEIDIDSLVGNRNKALYSLLITQSRIKRLDSITETDMKVIDIAIDYFSRHRDDSNYYPRALMAKGYVLELTTDINSTGLVSIRLYNEALKELKTDEHYWRGFGLLKLAELSNSNNNANHNTTRELYAQALSEFEKSGGLIKQAYCHYKIAAQYYSQLNDSGLIHSRKSLEIGRQLNDNEFISTNCTDIASYYLNVLKPDSALYYAKIAIATDDYPHTTHGGWPMLATAYSRLGMPDSAEWAAKKVRTLPKSALKIISLENVAESKRDYLDALVQMKYYYLFNDSVLRTEIQANMAKANELIENERLNAEKTELSRKIYGYAVALTVLAFLAAVLVIIMQRRKLAYRRALIDAERLRNDRDTLEKMNRLLIDKKAVSESRYVALSEFVNRRLEHTNALVEKLTINNKYVTIKDKMLLHTIVSEEDGAMSHLREYVNLTHDNLIKRITAEYPNLTSKDIDLICMTLCGFSTLSIQSVLNYSYDKGVFNARRRVLKKMGMNSMDDLVGKNKE